MLDIFNKFTFIAINVNLFFGDNDVQLERDEFKKNVINSINIKDNNYFIAI